MTWYRQAPRARTASMWRSSIATTFPRVLPADLHGLVHQGPQAGHAGTPHYFFSPDPFEKNAPSRKCPARGRADGLVQDSSDLWDATFFCGSCAIIRRAPLLEVGIAVETVTEDAHTRAQLHPQGYGTAYLAIPQARGWPQRKLSGHVELAHPLGAQDGADLPGRQSAVRARTVVAAAAVLPERHAALLRPAAAGVLTAPLAYLLFGAHVIQASALTIAIFLRCLSTCCTQRT
ncbi:hypothetical protein ACU4GD_13285 [Cupriavidus basilensis]